MIEKFQKHWVYYLSFALIQIMGLLIIVTAGTRELRLAAIFMTTIFYFTFAMVHHMMDHDLSTKIVIEYALMGCLGLMVSIFLFNY